MGRIRVQCQLEDLAEFVVSAQANVIVDNTAPVAVIAAPVNGDFITAATSIVGTGTDANLLEYFN